MKKHFCCTIIFLFTLSYLIGQTPDCDSIYKHPDTEAIFKSGSKDILDFVSKHITPIINECYKSESKPLSNLKIHLTINQSGKVMKAFLANTEVPGYCSKQVQNELVKMEGWAPGKQAGKPVCSIIFFYVNCKATDK